MSVKHIDTTITNSLKRPREEEESDEYAEEDSLKISKSPVNVRVARVVSDEIHAIRNRYKPTFIGVGDCSLKVTFAMPPPCKIVHFFTRSFKRQFNSTEMRPYALLFTPVVQTNDHALADILKLYFEEKINVESSLELAPLSTRYLTQLNLIGDSLHQYPVSPIDDENAPSMVLPVVEESTVSTELPIHSEIAHPPQAVRVRKRHQIKWPYIRPFAGKRMLPRSPLDPKVEF